MSSTRKTAIVTRASQGIGAGIVNAFAQRGCNVVANSRKVTQSTEVAAPEFTEYPKVADAASELLRDVLGDQTVSSRLVLGVASLPLGSSVELEVILEVKP
jgi:NAD(P)-dependent dehydrogenase (short-subunit alcohol dehydrogenase family)